MLKKNIIIDPIHGKIELPQWLVRIKDEPAIRRMMGIKQLGLKAFVNFPGAIHTRYLHSLGTMHLADKLSGLLVRKESSRRNGPRIGLEENLGNNRSALMAAGFFHDIGHGPFSHVMDFVLEDKFNLNHELITMKIVKLFEKELEGDCIPVGQINNLISKKSQYPFLWGIINGPLDVDKVDYVLRDSYHVGLRYSFDLDHFLDQIMILGDEDDLTRCELGLEKSRQAIACIELFLLLWKNMYTLVYLAEESRIAEKMLEKAILFAINSDSNLEEEIGNLENYLDLDEDKLKRILKECEGFSGEICDRVFKTADFYIPVLERDIEDFETSRKFTEELRQRGGEDKVSEKISQRLSEISSKPYSMVCDIISAKIPKEIHIDDKDEEGEPIEVKQRSDVIKAISKPKILIKVYVSPEIKKTKKRLTKEKIIKAEIQKLIEGW